MRIVGRVRGGGLFEDGVSIIQRNEGRWRGVYRCGLNGRVSIKDGHILSLDKSFNESSNWKGDETNLGRRVYKFSVVDRNDGSRRDRRSNSGCIFDRLCWYTDGSGHYGGGFVAWRVDVFRFRGGTIYIVDVPSPVGLGRSLVCVGPVAVDDELVQNFFLPRNADSGGESGGGLNHMNGASPLLEKEEGERKRVFKDLRSDGGCEDVPDQMFR